MSTVGTATTASAAATASDSLTGGAGDDVVDGNQGADFASLGDGNDTFVWDNGDGSDSVEGERRVRTRWSSTARPSRRRSTCPPTAPAHVLTRDLGNITMDLVGIEQVDTNSLTGPDTFTVDDLTGHRRHRSRRQPRRQPEGQR
jgi:Ca2+-binding RTX toxin-like protein